MFSIGEPVQFKTHFLEKSFSTSVKANSFVQPRS